MAAVPRDTNQTTISNINVILLSLVVVNMKNIIFRWWTKLCIIEYLYRHLYSDSIANNSGVASQREGHQENLEVPVERFHRNLEMYVLVQIMRGFSE